MQYKLIEEIRNTRIKLSYSIELIINVNSFYEDIKLTINLIRENLNNIYNLVKNNLKMLRKLNNIILIMLKL